MRSSAWETPSRFVLNPMTTALGSMLAEAFFELFSVACRWGRASVQSESGLDWTKKRSRISIA